MADPARDAAKARARAILAHIDIGDWSPAGSHIIESTARVYADGYRRSLRAVGYKTGAETINQARANLGRRPVAHGDVSPFGRPRRLHRASELRKDLLSDEETAAEADGDIGVSTDFVNELAIAWAKKHAADLVTQISENTRDMLESTVAEAIEEGWSAAELAHAIAESVGFSDARAELIARTELIDAYGQSSLDAYKASGVVEYKEWICGEDPCEDCQANEAESPIPIDDDFQSGDDAPAAHPRCVCSLVAAFPDEGEE